MAKTVKYTAADVSKVWTDTAKANVLGEEGFALQFMNAQGTDADVDRLIDALARNGYSEPDFLAGVEVGINLAASKLTK